MASTDAFLEEERRRFGAPGINDDDAAGAREAYLAVGRALVETPREDDVVTDDGKTLREVERLAREDAFSSLAMETIDRARKLVGRTKWSATDGLAKRRIVEALRCLAPDE